MGGATNITLSPGDPLPMSWVAQEIVISVVLCMIGAFLSLEYVEEWRQSRSRRWSVLWLVGTALSLGWSGIWSLHFVGMQAMHSLVVPIEYATGTTILTAAVIVAGVLAALVIAGGRKKNEKPELLRLLVASVVLAVCVGLMHYGGMMASCGNFTMEFNPGLFVLTVILAVVVSFVGLSLILYNRNPSYWIVVSTVIGGGVSVVHYTGMHSFELRYSETNWCPLDDNWLIASTTVGAWVAHFSAIISFGLQSIVSLAHASESHYLVSRIIAIERALKRGAPIENIKARQALHLKEHLPSLQDHSASKPDFGGGHKKSHIVCSSGLMELQTVGKLLNTMDQKAESGLGEKSFLTSPRVVSDGTEYYENEQSRGGSTTTISYMLSKGLSRSILGLDADSHSVAGPELQWVLDGDDVVVSFVGSQRGSAASLFTLGDQHQ
eukprot:Colp12_sorted_trinity150504_noHs@9336